MARSLVSVTPYWSEQFLPLEGNQFAQHCLLELQVEAPPEHHACPLNLAFVLDCSRSMQGQAIADLHQAVHTMGQALQPGDRLSIIRFNHTAEVLWPNQVIADSTPDLTTLTLQADGGTAIDPALQLGLQELVKHRQGYVSGLILLTDGENEHGDMEQCFKLGRQAVRQNATIHCVGLGADWSHPLLEHLADVGGGCFLHISQSTQIGVAFQHILSRMRSVACVNTTLWLQLDRTLRLQPQNPITQIQPEVVELRPQPTQGWIKMRLGDLLTHPARQVLVGLIHDSDQFTDQAALTVKLSYEDPTSAALQSTEPLYLEAQSDAKAQACVEHAVQKLSQYQQTALAQAALKRGDRDRALTHLQQAAQTAQYLGVEVLGDALETAITQVDTGGEMTRLTQRETYTQSKNMP